MTNFELKNVELIRFEDQQVGDIIIPASVMAKIDHKALAGLPVHLVRGAIKMKIGGIAATRRGRDAILGDVMLTLDCSLVVEFDEKLKVPKGISFDCKI